MARAQAPAKETASQISITVQAWKENRAYVAYAPELDLSSCGDTLNQAKARLREAISLFLEEAACRGTLADILAEAGFEKQRYTYRARRILAREKIRLAVPASS
jgi:predicted RNase H-like HicB family nuclease